MSVQPETCGTEDHSVPVEIPRVYKVLFVCTSTKESSWGAKTGIWLDEVSIPYYALKEAGYSIVICSIEGGAPPIDPGALNAQNLGEASQRFLNDEEAQSVFNSAQALADIVSNKPAFRQFSALYLVGGHGCVDDYPKSPALKEAVECMFSTIKGCVASICHGPIGFTNCEYQGSHLLKGKFVAAFSNEEEAQLGLLEKIREQTKTAEQTMDDCGAICVPASPW